MSYITAAGIAHESLRYMMTSPILVNISPLFIYPATMQSPVLTKITAKETAALCSQ
jgi:ABC-type dipeptide/oligopeptide/nickel transport system permease subunit